MPLSNEQKKHVQIMRVETRENPGYNNILKNGFDVLSLSIGQSWGN